MKMKRNDLPECPAKISTPPPQPVKEVKPAEVKPKVEAPESPKKIEERIQPQSPKGKKPVIKKGTKPPEGGNLPI